MRDLIIAIIGPICVIIGVAIVEIRLGIERKGKYQVITFEKRLELHQQAFAWCMKISNLLGQSYGDVSSEVATIQAMELNKLYNEANDWWGSNCLYLDDDSRLSMFTAIGLPLDRAEQLIGDKQATNEFRQEARDTLKKTIRYITKGIGSEYLPDIDRGPRKRIIPPQ